MGREFWRLLSGCTVQTLALLCNFQELRSATRVFDVERRCVTTADEKIPWLVILLANGYSKKHIFFRGSPSLRRFGDGIRSSVNRLRWRSILGDADHRAWWRLRPKRAPSAPCSEIVPPFVPVIQRELQLACAESFDSATRRSKSNGKLCRNVAAAHQYGLKWLDTHKYVLCPSDKLSGFALCPAAHLARAIRDKTPSTMYTEVAANSIAAVTITNAMKSIVVRISKALEEPSFKSFRCKLIGAVDSSKILLPLVCNLKDHKPSGEVAPRILHSGSCTPFGPMGKVIGKFIRQKLVQLPHLVNSTAELLNRVRALRLPEDCRMAEIDIKDYYNMGSTSQHVASAFTHLESGDLKSSLQDALGLILDTQFVEDRINSRTLRATTGSGQGLTLSGDVADSTAFEIFEKTFAAKESIHREFNIFLYCRYRDNILVIAETHFSIGRFLSCLRRAGAGTYKFTLEGMSQYKLPVLDIEFYKPNNFGIFGKLGYRPRFKPAESVRYLADDSCHAESIHDCWPVMQLARLRRLSDNSEHFELARAEWQRRVATSFCSPLALAKIATAPYVPRCMRLTGNGNGSPKKSSPFYVTIPYHPSFKYSGLQKYFAELSARWRHELEEIGISRLAIAWRRSGQNIGSFLRKEFDV